MGTNNTGNVSEVGNENVYLGGSSDNQLFEIEGRRNNDDSLYTEFVGEAGKFYELNFDVAARALNSSPLKVSLVDVNDSSNVVEIYEFNDAVNRNWNNVQEFFQVPSNGTYRVLFESSQADSYGALLDNITLSTRSNVGYEDTFIDVSDIKSVNLNDTDGSEVLTLLIQGLPTGAIVSNGTLTSIADAAGEVDISGWDDLNDLQIKVFDTGTYTITIKATASEQDDTYSPIDKIASQTFDIIALTNPEAALLSINTPPEVTDFEFFVSG